MRKPHSSRRIHAIFSVEQKETKPFGLSNRGLEVIKNAKMRSPNNLGGHNRTKSPIRSWF